MYMCDVASADAVGGELAGLFTVGKYIVINFSPIASC
jgi:hypothetical protein